MFEWISFEDGIPDSGREVDLWLEISGRHCRYIPEYKFKGDADNNFFRPLISGRTCIRFLNGGYDDATHWMYSPPPPNN